MFRPLRPIRACVFILSPPDVPSLLPLPFSPTSHPFIHFIPLYPLILTIYIPLSYPNAPYFPLSFFPPHPLPSPPFYPPHTLLRRICFVPPSNKGTQKRRKNEQGTKEERTKWVPRGGKCGEKEGEEKKGKERGENRVIESEIILHIKRRGREELQRRGIEG